MDLEKLRIFLTVAECRSFSLGAKRLYISHSTTSRAVSLVSTQKGGKWFYDGADVTPVAVRMLVAASGYPLIGPKPSLTAAEVWRLAEKDRLSFMEAALKAEKLGFFAQGGSQPFNKE